MRDKGTTSPSTKDQGIAPVRLTSQLPATLSPMHRAANQIGPSPKMPPHIPSRGAGSSSSSSNTSSPIHSPHTNPGSGNDSPQKDAINLPPPAFPSQHTTFTFPGSVPVKIPKLAPKQTNSPALAAHAGSHGASLFAIGNSIDTLRFGRKPGMVNSVTSPNALIPRCACGKPAGHTQRRASSKERLEGGVAGLSLGPSLTAPAHHSSSGRVVSNPIKRTSQSGHGTPRRRVELDSDLEHHTVSSTLNAASLLARSHSDPTPPHLLQDGRQSLIAPLTRQDPSSVLPMPDTVPGPSGSHSRTDRRGRSLERPSHSRLEMTDAGPLNQSREREQAPSRSRHRRDERPERRTPQVSAAAPRPVYANGAEADWTRRASSGEVHGAEGIVPASRRQEDRGRPGYGIRTNDL